MAVFDVRNIVKYQLTKVENQWSSLPINVTQLLWVFAMFKDEKTLDRW